MHVDAIHLEVVLYKRHEKARKIGIDELEAKVLGDGRVFILPNTLPSDHV